MLKKTIWIILAILFLIADQIIKVRIANSSIDINLWGDFLNIAQSKNYGIFASIPFNSPEIVVIFILIVLFLFIKRSKRQHIVIPFIITTIGVVGNLIDRIRFGFVLDYINILNFSHFNIADLLIYIGCGLIILKIIRNNKYQTLNINN